MTTNFSLGWAATYNPETVTIKPKTAEGTYGTSVTVEYASRAKATKRQVEKLGTEVVSINAWKAKLGGTVPLCDYELVAGGVTYVIGDVEVCDHGERFRLGCIKL